MPRSNGNRSPSPFDFTPPKATRLAAAREPLGCVEASPQRRTGGHLGLTAVNKPYRIGVSSTQTKAPPVPQHPEVPTYRPRNSSDFANQRDVQHLPPTSDTVPQRTGSPDSKTSATRVCYEHLHARTMMVTLWAMSTIRSMHRRVWRSGDRSSEHGAATDQSELWIVPAGADHSPAAFSLGSLAQTKSNGLSASGLRVGDSL